MKKFDVLFFIPPLTALLVSLLGRLLTRESMDWYSTINLPVITPPRWVFSPVWISIFILTTISVCIVVTVARKSSNFKLIMSLFAINALLNVLWSYLFFNQHLIGWALVDAIVLTVTVWLLIWYTWPESWFAALLLVPYASWSTFAVYLNYLIWTLN